LEIWTGTFAIMPSMMNTAQQTMISRVFAEYRVIPPIGERSIHAMTPPGARARCEVRDRA
jgi:hypothetical protein